MNGLYTPHSIRTASGEFINPVKIKPEQVRASDIATGLARECRFGNFTSRFYSVADHSIWCMRKGEELYPDDRELHLGLLLHDAHEAYLGDLCTPLVDSIDSLYPGVKNAVDTVKKIVQHAINQRFGLRYCPLADERVKKIDRMALEYEWENKVLRWTGFPVMVKEEVAAAWLHYFKILVKVPVVI